MLIHPASITEAQERIANGEDPSLLVHEIWCGDWNYPDNFYGLSSSITVEDFQHNGYIERYYSLGELANM